jgi:hypothetical protein
VRVVPQVLDVPEFSRREGLVAHAPLF